MTTSDATEKKPLWLLIEENILSLESQVLSGGDLEASIKQMANQLDESGYNVSKHGGNLIKLRFAVDKARQAGKPMLKDVNAAIGALSLEDVADPYAAATKLLDGLEGAWPELKNSERRPDVVAMVENTRLDLLVAKAKGLEGDQSIRLLIQEEVDEADILARLEITQEKLNQVKADIAKELAERKRVAALLEKVAEKPDAERVKYLFENEVSEALILEMAGVDQAAIDAAKKAMEEELKEKQRLAEEEAARKKKEAEGPALEDIQPDQMLEYIESIREIMEFSEEEKEIRVMCEQSSIPKALVDIAVSEPAKLDELEKAAQG